MNNVDFFDLTRESSEESSEEIRKRVDKAVRFRGNGMKMKKSGLTVS